MPAQHLILAAVGPVQEFIAAGRKVRDVWYGSYCLSELSKLMAALLAEKGCTLVFPAPEDPDADLRPESELNVVNRVLAVAPDGKNPADLCREMQEAAQAFWRDLGKKALAEGAGLVDEAIFKSQLSDLGEFYAVWASMDGGYANARKRVEELMSARKCARIFRAPSWNGFGRFKSSLDGVRETVLRDGAAARSRGRIRDGEHLDALGFVKRMGSFKQDRFDSLVDVAVRTTEARRESDPSFKEDYDQLRKSGKDLAKTELDGDIQWPEMLYEGRLESVLRERARAGETPNSRVAAFQEDVRNFCKKYGEPEGYLCFLLGDGDHMGKTLDALPDMAAHQRFSRELSRFAKEARGVVERHAGELIYSGGDDVMAYLPLHTALQCASELNSLFGEVMAAACAGRPVTPPTFSAGLVITHHSESLAEIFERAREAEHHAKEFGARNALAICQNKRGQRGIQLAGKWSDLPERMREFIDLYLDKALPSRFGYQLRALSKQCGGKLEWKDKAGDEPQPDNVASAELLRVLGRKAVTKETRVKLLRLLAKYGEIKDLSDELIVARQLAAAQAASKGRSLTEEE